MAGISKFTTFNLAGLNFYKLKKVMSFSSENQN